MKGDWLENKMRDRMENLDSPLNLAEAWTELEDRRALEKRKKYPLFWWSGLGVGLLFALSILYFINDRSVNEAALLGSLPVEIEIPKTKSTVLPQNKKEAKESTRQSSQINPEKNQSEKTPLESIATEGRNYDSEVLLNRPIGIDSIKSTLALPASGLKPAEFQKLRDAYQGTEFLRSPRYVELKSIEFNETEGLSDLGLPLLPHRTKLTAKTSFFTFGLSAFYGTNRRRLHATHQSFNELAERRKDTEKTLDTWSLQLNLNYRNKGYLLLSSYLEFQQNTDSFEDTYTLENEIILENQIVRVNNYPDGNSEEIQGASTALESNTTRGSYYQKYRSLNFGFPVGLKKEIQSSSFAYVLQIGPEVSLFRSASGYVFDDNAEPGSYTTLSNIVIKDNLSLRAVLQSELSLQVGNAGEVGFGVRLKQDLTPAYTFKKGEETFENYSEKRTYYQSYLTWRILF